MSCHACQRATNPMSIVWGNATIGVIACKEHRERLLDALVASGHIVSVKSLPEPEQAEFPTTAPRCGSCRFWRRDRCRRFPPSKDGVWPMTDAEDWCGEYQQATTDKETTI